MKLADGTSLFVKRSTKPPQQRPARVGGKFERLLGDKTTCVYVPFSVASLSSGFRTQRSKVFIPSSVP